MDIIYEALRKTEILILGQEEAELKEFFIQFYEVKSLTDIYEKTLALTYCKILDTGMAKKIKSKYVWSATEVTAEVKTLLPVDCVVIETKDIKQEYIKRFLGNCSA
ncbi:MAG: hypothetical protein WCJ46_03270 [bacterium]